MRGKCISAITEAWARLPNTLRAVLLVLLVVSSSVVLVRCSSDTDDPDGGNLAPTAHAGPNQTVRLGATVSLDGSESSDPDGDSLSFHWTLIVRPDGSAARLSDPHALHPTLRVDQPGAYTVQLIVNDGTRDSAPAIVVISTRNSPPVARAGPNQTGVVGTRVHLDGSESSDVDGDRLHFAWTFLSKPVRSRAVLSQPVTVTPTFLVDQPGTYVVQLIVNDRTVESAPDTVIIRTRNSRPVADAGPDRTVTVDETVQLNGSGSQDVDGGPLTYRWAFTSTPAGSLATLSDPTRVDPTFTVDQPGTYVVQLIVNDGTLNSRPDTVVISTRNSRPVARAGTDQRVDVGDTVQLDGSASQDADNDALSFQWALTVLPEDSTATLSDPTVEAPTFIADRAGTYVAQLRVHDGTVASRPDTVRIIAQRPAPAFRAIADCAPIRGPAPLQVAFRSRGEFAGGSLVRYRWDFEGDGTFDTDDAVARDFQFTFPSAGTFNAVLEVTNNRGGTATDTCPIRVTGAPPTAVANATPSNGAVPLTVHFTCRGTAANGEIARYEWDFEGDGVFDMSSATSGTTNHTYTAEGTFVAMCRVTDAAGLQGNAPTTTTIIHAGPPGTPRVLATAAGASGESPLTVTFSGNARDDGRIVQWEWDFDGDGVFDFVSRQSPDTTHRYTTAGVFAAALRVTDNTGVSSIDTVEVVVNITATLAVPNNTLAVRPAGTFANLVRSVPVTTNVSSAFSGFGPERAIDGDLQTSWFTADGDAANLGTTPFYEVIFPVDVTVVQINMRGNREFAEGFDFFRGRFDVYGDNGRVVFSRILDLPAPERDVDLDIPDQTLVRRVRFTSLADESREPGFAELEILGPVPPAAIVTTLDATVPVSLVLQDSGGTVVRRLLTDVTRTAGTYTDQWDGRDDTGELLPQGVYYALLEYPLAGEVRRVDLTNTTGGNRSSPEVTPAPLTFAPFAGQPLRLDFRLSQAAEVTAFMGRLNVDTRLLTFFERLPFGGGTHRIIWNGENAQGQLIHPPSGDLFMMGIFQYTLPDNAIFLESGVEVSDLSVTPSIFDPSGRLDQRGTPAHSSVTFALNRQADVELVVSDATTGSPVANRLFAARMAGSNTITWDGRDDQGVLVAPGRYRIGVAASDRTGHRSLRLYALQRIYY